MKYLFLYCLLVICDGVPLQEAPKNVELSTFRNHNKSGFVVSWTPVENESDPILGYKVLIWEEEAGFAYELKEDGTLEPKTTEQVPVVNHIHQKRYDYLKLLTNMQRIILKSVYDGSVFPFFELKENGEFVLMGMQDMMWKIWQKRTKVVYKVNPDGTLQSLKAADIPALKIRDDTIDFVKTELEVPPTESSISFNGAKRSYIYEVAVQAFTASSTGPLSHKRKIVTY